MLFLNNVKLRVHYIYLIFFNSNRINLRVHNQGVSWRRWHFVTASYDSRADKFCCELRYFIERRQYKQRIDKMCRAFPVTVGGFVRTVCGVLTSGNLHSALRQTEPISIFSKYVRRDSFVSRPTIYWFIYSILLTISPSYNEPNEWTVSIQEQTFYSVFARARVCEWNLNAF